MRCSQCDHPLTPRDRFCARCGAPSGTRQPTVCQRCRTDVPMGAIFCPACGAHTAIVAGVSLSDVMRVGRGWWDQGGGLPVRGAPRALIIAALLGSLLCVLLGGLWLLADVVLPIVSL